MAKFELDPNEKSLGKWTLNYILPQGGHYLGKLEVTDKRLIFEAKYDTSLQGVLKETMYHVSGTEGYVIIPKSMIQKMTPKSSFFKKKVTLQLEDDTEHVFDYGLLGIKKLVAAIEQ